MAVLVLGGPPQQPNRHTPADEPPQPLARAVPVDHEHEPRAEVLEEAPDRHVGARLEPAGGEVEQAALHRLVVPRARVLPGHCKRRQQLLEEQQPCEVNVGVGDRHDRALDPDHHDVPIGRAEVVLDQQRRPAPGRDRTESGMLELDTLGGVHSPHERSDQHAVGVGEVVDVGAVDQLGRDLAREPIQLTMGVHHHKVQRVSVVFGTAGQPRDVLGTHQIAVDAQLGRYDLDTFCEVPRRGDFCDAQWLEHRLGLLDRPPRERLRARDAIPAIRLADALGYDPIQPRVLDAAGDALLSQGALIADAIGGRARGLQ